MTRVLVCGSRGIDCRGEVHFILSALLNEQVQYERGLVVIEGGCPTGADLYAAEWAEAEARRQPGWVSHETYPADWEKHGKAAGHIRNKRMLEHGQPDIVLAFVFGALKDGDPVTSGTGNMVGQARKAGVPVVIHWSVE